MIDVHAAWRENREPGWTKDIGYDLQRELSRHFYRYDRKGTRPDDPGWHECGCGWEGYWSEYYHHVADLLRAIAVHETREQES